MRERLKAFLAGLGGEPTTVLCGASLILAVSHYRGSAGYFGVLTGGRFADHPAAGALGHFYWFGASVVLYGVVPLVLAAVTRGSFTNAYGLGLGDWRTGLTISGVFFAVMLPAVYVASRLPQFHAMYPLAGGSAYTITVDGTPRTSVGLFVAYEAAYVAYFIGWEFLFRGWMVHGLLKDWGRGPAILVQVAPFVVMHVGKAELETYGSILAGVALGALSVQTRSFWYGAFLHGSIAVWMDWLSARDKLV